MVVIIQFVRSHIGSTCVQPSQTCLPHAMGNSCARRSSGAKAFTGVRVYIIIESENAIHKHVRIGCLFLPDGEGLGKRGCLQDGRRGAAEAGDLVGNVALERLGPHAIHAGRMASVGGGAAC